MIVLVIIPETIKMINWIRSGILINYVYILAPVNLMIIVLGILLMIYLKRNSLKDNYRFLVLNLITLFIISFWILYSY